jgi:hypothetical protein
MERAASLRHGVPAVYVRRGESDPRCGAEGAATFRSAATAASAAGLLPGTAWAATIHLGAATPAATGLLPGAAWAATEPSGSPAAAAAWAVALHAEATRNPPGNPPRVARAAFDSVGAAESWHPVGWAAKRAGAEAGDPGLMLRE